MTVSFRQPHTFHGPQYSAEYCCKFYTYYSRLFY